ncbi:sterol desaturase family protein [Pseudoalteromonas luteoviolacea]|uniref:sterol desaturase family protein n=1 Tax=Pseudoalteromonas luteoviolacea TaxID=43657 RepID=UPI001B37CA6D|nr:sterol desaturase family protein [Pseudoalteromonas luteoviolacea]MBQ4835210.1 sterol desaturase family protein [Pseudoalteromonas luteoviolacea]
MDFLTYSFSTDDIWWLETFIDDWFLVIALSLFVIELIRYGLKKTFTRNLLGDSITNFITLGTFVLIVALVAATYAGVFFYVYDNFKLVELPLTPWTILCCIVLADLAYYWEHRFLHKNGFAWATHTVHHSSPHFNISVAYRHGPLDWLFPLFFHLPLAILGFNPFIIFLAEVVVQVYQTLLHTETVKKLPRPIEAIFNTPSHHRVHHATNKQYLDKNYAGIFIVWDRMFGTFAKEDVKVKYGIYPAVKSINPVTVFFSGYVKLVRQMWHAPNWRYRWNLLIKPPLWAWQQENKNK